MQGLKSFGRLAGLSGVAMLLASAPAWSTAGYFALGYSPEQVAQGGAGVANGDEAMSSALNPAGVAGVGNELSLGIQLFAPFREYTGTGTRLPYAGTVKSGHNYFLVPNFAYNKVLANGARLNFAAYGNGGMNTSYPAVANSVCSGFGSSAPGNTGIFCDGKAGVNLNQLFLSVTYADKVGNLSWGIAPTIAVQQFSARGIGLFGNMGYSADPSNFSSGRVDTSYGIGLRGGIEYAAAPNLRFGMSFQTKMKMSKFKSYAGLFANGGEFDIPAAATIGAAYDVSPDVTLMFDYEHIWYSGVDAVANPFPNGTAKFGAANGPGFGWNDVDVVKLGASWKSSPKMTWRFGYAYSTNPVPSDQVLMNVFAPGVVRHHLSAGGSWKMDDRDTLDFAVLYVPTSNVSGAVPSSLGGGSVKLSMHQFAASIGWTRKF